MNLIEYLPPVTAETEEFKAICEAEQPDIDTAWGNIDGVLKESFVETAEDEGLKRLEKICELSSTGLSIEQRRLNIIAKLMGDTPYTMCTLYDRLQVLCGDDFVFEYGEDEWTLVFKTSIENSTLLLEIRKMLLRCVPANIGLRGGISYSAGGSIYAAAIMKVRTVVEIG